jgi:hypothetical protein
MNTKSLYIDQPCERCGSKKKLTKIRNESISNIGGASILEYSRIICTDSVCQAEFETKIEEKKQKDESIRLKREENKAARVKARA